MKTTFIATVLNEEKNISFLLDSLLSQTKPPNEIIIVDAESTDQTYNLLLRYKKNNPKRNITVIKKSGNRSIGRNEAISKSKGDIILCSDSGCILDSKWIENITKPFLDKSVDVVSGYYKGLSKNIFQKCLIPYVLTMPDKVNHKEFLPASRSMAFKRDVWKRLGGFPEQYSFNEDFVFAKKLKKIGAKIVFVQNAIVFWVPRDNIIESMRMFYTFARGDIEARIIRPKAILIFLRYIIGFIILIWNKDLLLVLLGLYIMWSIEKNYKYVSDIRGVLILPTLQLVSDVAVILGTIRGLF